MRRLNTFFILTFFSVRFFAQHWSTLLEQPGANFYTVRTGFNNYFATHDSTEKGKGWKQFKRWEYFMEPRVYPSGDLTLPSQNMQNFETFLQTYSTQKLANSSSNMIASSTWTAVGPFGAINGNAGGQFLKSGRLNFITIHPAGSNTLFVGAPAGGLWKSVNGGTSWTTNTDFLTVTGCSDLVIDPSNNNTMYLATGDGDAGDDYSIGVLKSTDGGTTWVSTGLAWTVNQGRLIRRLLINPSNPQIILAATNIGIYRTTNGGTNWTQVFTSSTYDLEFKPGDPNTVYAGGTTFRKSIDGGVTWTTISTGIPTTGVNRMAIAVTPNDANYVYVLASSSADDGFQGLYRSINSGTGFTTMATSPNLLGWSNTGGDTGGQGWYDLCVAASPLNKDEVVVGGVNVWRSTNGGTNWSIYGHWTGSGAPFTHADHHDLEYDASGNLFDCNDGTVYRRTPSATSWQEISGLMNISQIYKIGTSALTANYWFTGHQDNGTSWWNGTTYAARMGGDGMDCFIDRTNNNNVFASYYSGQFQRSTNGGTSWSTPTGFSGTGNWVSPWKQDPQTATVIWAGKQQMFKSTNSGTSFVMTTGSMAGTAGIVEFAIAPSNNQVLYVIKGTTLFKTTDGGATWTNITGTVPTGSGAPTFITVSPTDANKLWVTLSGYSAGNKVFMSTNGGTTWTNYTSNLPNLPANCSVYQVGSSDRIYVGMDVGVYYRDASMTSWTLYNTGLPNTAVSDMEISPADPTKLIAATYGRGVWVVDVISGTPPAPVSGFSVASAGICSGQNAVFNDQSTNTPTAWSWSVTPSAGVTINTSASQNPTVSFSNGGTYVVSMIASNAGGPGTLSSQTITVNSTPTVLVSNANQTVCVGSPVTFNASGATAYSWTGGGTGASVTYTPSAAGSYTVTGSNGSCSSSAIANVSIKALPSVAVSGANAICTGASAILAASGATSYVWNTSATTSTVSVSPSSTTSYTVTGTGSNGCVNMAVKTVSVNPLPVISTALSSTAVCVGSNASLVASGASTYTWMPGNLIGSNVTATPSSNTTYTVNATDANGCTNSAIRSVIVNPLPALNTTASNTSICNGQSTSLSASGAVSYTWMPGSVVGNPVSVNPSVNTAYTVTGRDVNGCVGTSVRNIVVNPSPVVSVSNPNQTICSGNSVTFNASGASAYVWSNGGGTGSSATYNPASSASYTVTGTTAGCSSNTVVNVVVNTTPTVSVSNPNQTICSGNAVTFNASGASAYVWSNGGGTGSSATYNPSSNASYTVTGTSTGCSSNAVVSVIVNTTPTVSVSNSNQTICSGNAVTFNASGASAYVWSNGGGSGSSATYNPSSNTSYTVTGSNGSCSSMAVANVNVNPTPTVTIANASQTICAGSAVTFSASGATSYNWSAGGIVTSVAVYTPSVSTNYTVTGTSSACSGNAVASVNVVTCTGLNEAGNMLQAIVYPNPTSGKIMVDGLGAYNTTISIEVADVLGKIHARKVIDANKAAHAVEIDLSDVANGVYFLKLSTQSNKTGVIKIIKE
ncbi:MAG: T9SS type A sorting domain-containing protein [Sediminibacterium sp.]|nr:T9SS type A sorting domain-containing protein [Sediminibacterium sp.]